MRTRCLVVVLVTLAAVSAPAAAPAPPPATPAAAAPGPCPPPKTAAAFREEAEALVAPSKDPFAPHLSPFLLTFAPLWPTRWPAVGGGVVYWTYDSDVPGTGNVCYDRRGPLHTITYPDLRAVPERRAFGRGKPLGRECDGLGWVVPKPELARAEQALIDIVAGCRSPEAARADLAPYSDWLRLHPAMARYLEKRVPRFVAWLKRATPGH